MKLIKVILSILAAFFLLWVIVAFFSPKYIGVKESIIIEQSSSTIFNQVNDLKNWSNWDEWSRRDSLMIKRYSANSKGKNASISWEGEEGNGTQQILESIAYEKIRLHVSLDDWDDSFSNWEFEELLEFETKVTWTFEDAEISFFLRPMGFSFNNAIRNDYQKSLANLKFYCESQAQQNKKLKPSLIHTEAFNYIGKHIATSFEDIGPQMGKSYGELLKICSDNEWNILGMPFSISYINENEYFEFDVAFKIDNLITPPLGYVSGIIPEGETVSISHFGLYENLPASYSIIENWIEKNGYVKNGNSYEVYITDPGSEPDTSKWETQIFYPVLKRVE